MIFPTRVNNIPCQCSVVNYSPYRPMQIYGSGMGDCHPPEEEEFDFEILDTKGRHAPWLEKYLTDQTTAELLEEFHILKQADYYD